MDRRAAVARVEEAKEVPERVGLARDPQRAIIGEPELFLGRPEEVLEQRVVQAARLHGELARDVAAPAHADANVSSGSVEGRRRRSAAPHFLHNAAQCAHHHGTRVR